MERLLRYLDESLELFEEVSAIARGVSWMSVWPSDRDFTGSFWSSHLLRICLRVVLALSVGSHLESRLRSQEHLRKDLYILESCSKWIESHNWHFLYCKQIPSNVVECVQKMCLYKTHNLLKTCQLYPIVIWTMGLSLSTFFSVIF